MKPITPTEVRRILEVTDRLGIHREGVVIPLAKEGLGGIRLAPGGRLEITVPADSPFETWLEYLPAVISRLNLRDVKKVEPEE